MDVNSNNILNMYVKKYTYNIEKNGKSVLEQKNMYNI